MEDLYELTFGFVQQLSNLTTILFNFLFSEIKIGDWEFSLWQLIGGGIIVILLVAWLIKKLIPIA